MDKEAQLAASAFGFQMDHEPLSLCPYGPVYRLRKDGCLWVLKRTGFPNSTAAALSNWLKALDNAGVDVVSPNPEFEPNPRTVDGASGDWVVYPYIEGQPYSGTPEQIEAAGGLLGRMHAAGAALGEDMRCVSHLPVHDTEWLRGETERALTVVGQVAPEVAARFGNLLAARIEEYEKAIATLAGIDLPLAACSWDFKASNLVYAEGRGPVLVDPDHGGRMPRLYDLACGALLFHTDCGTAPGRLFDGREWRQFLKGYAASVQVTELERRHWQDALLAAWMDQGLWLLGNWPEGWEDERTRACLMDLATSDLRALGRLYD